MAKAQGSIAPLLGAVAFVVVLSAAWFAMKPADTSGLPMPPWTPAEPPEAPVVADPVAPTASATPPPTPDLADPEATASLATRSDLIASKMEIDRRKMVALAHLGPDFEAEVDRLHATAVARLETIAAEAATGALTEAQAADALEQAQRAFSEAMIGALPPEALDRLRAGDAGRDQP